MAIIVNISCVQSQVPLTPRMLPPRMLPPRMHPQPPLTSRTTIIMVEDITVTRSCYHRCLNNIVDEVVDSKGGVRLHFFL